MDQGLAVEAHFQALLAHCPEAFAVLDVVVHAVEEPALLPPGVGEGSSASLAQELRQQGFRDAWALVGGYDAWLQAGLPVESKAKAA